MSYATICCSSPEYAAALADKGFSTESTVTYQGKTYTHSDIAERFDAAYQKYRGEYPMICGANPRQEARYKRQFERAVKSDVYGDFGISWWTIAMGALMTFLGGPLGLVIAVVTVLFEHYLQKDLENDKVFAAAVGPI
jgi:hypothetical protein